MSGVPLLDEVAAKLTPFIDEKIQKMITAVSAENKKTNENIDRLRDQLVKAGLIK